MPEAVVAALTRGHNTLLAFGIDRFADFSYWFSHDPELLIHVRANFQSQMLRLPKTTTAIALGHSGSRWPATRISGRIINRANCAKEIRPNMMLATRSPKVCELIFCYLLNWRTSVKDRFPADPAA